MNSEHLKQLNRIRVARFRKNNPLYNRDCYQKARERILAEKKVYYMQKKRIRKVFIVAADGPCGTNFFGAFASKKAAEARSAELNLDRHEWDRTFVMEMKVE